MGNSEPCVWETLEQKRPGRSPLSQSLGRCSGMKTHTYFTESPLILVRTGTAKPGPPSVSGTDPAILAGIWSACWKHCENRKQDSEGMLGGVTPLMVALFCSHPLLNDGTP